MHEEEGQKGPKIAREARRRARPGVEQPYQTYIRRDDASDVEVETDQKDGTQYIAIRRAVEPDNIEGNPFYITVWVARTVNEWRIFPRLFVVGYLWMLYTAVMWFTGLPDPNMAQSTFISTVIGAGAAWFGLYVGTGNRKGKTE